MAINLEKGQKINLEKSSGGKLQQFCVGCNWGMREESSFFGLKKDKVAVDLDLSCVMFDDKGEIRDHIYSPEYRPEFLSQFGMPAGKLTSADGALRHSGDDRIGDAQSNNDDNETIVVDLDKVADNISQIFFFLNIVQSDANEDFSMVPFASIRMFEGTPTTVKNVVASYNVATDAQFAGKLSMIMGKLYRRNGEWKFAAIGDASSDQNICKTILRIIDSYAK